jgi:hypothetical protein
LLSPTTVTVDQASAKLYIIDGASLKIYWYQLIALPNGNLITDGQQHVAVDMVSARGISVDGVGNLYFSGSMIRLPTLPPQGGILKRSAVQMAINAPADVVYTVYDGANSGGRVQDGSVAAVESDGTYLFWTHSKNGKASGVLNRALAVPPMTAKKSIIMLADNSDTAGSLCITSKFVIFTTPTQLMSVPRSKAADGCAAGGCVVINDKLQEPVGAVYDLDGTVYVADGEGIKSFPAFASDIVEADMFASGAGIGGVALLSTDAVKAPAQSSAAAPPHRSAPLAAAVGFALQWILNHK